MAPRYILVRRGTLRIVDYPRDGVYSLVEFDSEREAYRYLQRFSHNPNAISRLEELLDDDAEDNDQDDEDEAEEEDDDEDGDGDDAYAGRSRPAHSMQKKRDILAEIAELIVEEQVGVAEQEHRTNPPTTLDEKEQAAPQDQPPTPGHDKKLAYIEIKIVDEQSGKPVKCVRLVVKTPDGNENYYSTDSNGLVRIDDLEPGTCDVWCELKNPKLEEVLAFVKMGGAAGQKGIEESGNGQTQKPGTLIIANIECHKVKKGETLDSLAKKAAMTWKELAKFNWDTGSPDEINTHLRDDVGCTEKTADGANYRFGDDDTPGIIYIPSKWTQDGLATGTTHILRVKVIAPPAALCVRLAIDPQEAKENSDKFTLSSTGGQYSVQKTVKDDQQPGDRYVDLCYTNLDATLAYTLKVTREGAQPTIIFENVPYNELAGLSDGRPEHPSGAAATTNEQAEFPEYAEDQRDKTGED